MRAAGIYNGVFTMVDDETGSVWSHLDGRAVAGPLEGEQLTLLPLQTTTWGAWLDEHPHSTTPDLAATGLAWLLDYEQRTGRPFRDAVDIGEPGLGDSFRSTLPAIDPRLAEHALVIGVLVAGEARAFPLEARPADGPIEDTIGGVPLVLLEDANGVPVLAYHRALSDGRVLSFERRDMAVYDRETGSRWNAGGLATSGPLGGVQLTFITSFLSEWYGWAAFHPGTSIFPEASEDGP